MKYVLHFFIYMTLFFVVMFGISAMVGKKKAKPVYYNYEYVIPEDSLTVGRVLVVKAIDSIPPGQESGAIIHVEMTTP